MQIEEAVMQIINGGKEVFIYCRNEAHQEQLRVSAFHIRRKLEKFKRLRKEAETVGIQKYPAARERLVNPDSDYYIRIYKKDALEFFQRDPTTGGLVPMTEMSYKEDSTADTDRMVMLMKKDGKNDEEIKAYLEEPNGESNVS